jgi:uncharacterized protein (DUF488 family)
MKSPVTNPVFTIGHSNHPFDKFLALLKQHNIVAVADVRSAPYSRRNPQYNRNKLQASLNEAGIQYVFLGKELGARSEDPDCYVDDRVQYDRLAQTGLFRSGIERLLEGRKTLRIALMCAEKEPLNCHRTILVARALERRGVQIRHILPDGALEAHADTMSRLIAGLGLAEDDLFLDRDALTQTAYARQAEKIAYRRGKTS